MWVGHVKMHITQVLTRVPQDTRSVVPHRCTATDTAKTMCPPFRKHTPLTEEPLPVSPRHAARLCCTVVMSQQTIEVQCYRAPQ
jgi:hypothetical protein